MRTRLHDEATDIGTDVSVGWLPCGSCDADPAAGTSADAAACAAVTRPASKSATACCCRCCAATASTVTILTRAQHTIQTASIVHDSASGAACAQAHCSVPLKAEDETACRRLLGRHTYAYTSNLHVSTAEVLTGQTRKLSPLTRCWHYETFSRGEPQCSADGTF